MRIPDAKSKRKQSKSKNKAKAKAKRKAKESFFKAHENMKISRLCKYEMYAKVFDFLGYRFQSIQAINC